VVIRGGANAVNARDRIGNGPWQNAKGAIIAASVADLHSDNKMSKANPTFPTGPLILEFCRQNLNRINGR
jgi:hypothetical protein